MIEQLVIIVSKNEVESEDISPALGTLQKLIESPEIAKEYRENVDIAFDGYNNYVEEVFEIPEIRKYVYKLDEQFPFWLYFLSKKHLGLQALLLCFLPPYLTEEGKQETFPERIAQLLTKRWLPALNHIGEFVGMSDEENQAITERTVQYIFNGPLRIKGVVKPDNTDSYLASFTTDDASPIEVNIEEEVARYLDESSKGDQLPTLVLVMGGIAAGKTRFRHEKFSSGYVDLDAGEIFNNLTGDGRCEFPSIYEESVQAIGSELAYRALSERRNIVCELIGDLQEKTLEMITAIKSIGYSVDVHGLTCDLDVAMERNQNRGEDNISAHFTQEYHIDWLKDGALRIQECSVFKPDYGSYLASTGASNSIEHGFYDLPIDHLIRVDSDTITSTVNIQRDESVYAASFDVTRSLFNKLLSILPAAENIRVSEWLDDPVQSKNSYAL